MIRRKVFCNSPLLQAQCAVISAACSSPCQSVTPVSYKLAAPVTDLLISGFYGPAFTNLRLFFIVYMFKSTEPLAGHADEGDTNTAYHPLLIGVVFTATP
jgi:hypothetical protein